MLTQKFFIFLRILFEPLTEVFTLFEKKNYLPEE